MSSQKISKMSYTPNPDMPVSTISGDIEKHWRPSDTTSEAATSSSSTISTSTSESSDDEISLPSITRKKGLSFIMTLLNFLKGMIGPGCLSLPVAFKQSGLWCGFSLVFIFGFLNNYCMLQLVHCSQYLSRKKGDAHLDYGNVAYEACENSFKWLRPYKHIVRIIVNTTIIALQVGICSVFYVFVGVHTRIGYCSAVGNVLMIISLGFIFQYLIRAEHVMSELPWISDFNGILTACGSILYSFEGQAMVLPMENKLKNPKNMIGPFGVLSTGMSLVSVVYAACGFFGYITYGNNVEGSITLNLPNSVQFNIVKIFLTLVVSFGFMIQQYVIVEMTWPTLHKNVLTKKIPKAPKLPFELFYRAFLVITAMSIAIAIPNLEQIIPLVGVSCGMMLAFVFPALIDTITFLPPLLRKHARCESEHEKRKAKISIYYRILQNSVLVIVGCFGCIAGLQSTIRDLIQSNTH
uniref:Amino acid transporter transmembrane domain-containing protein n=2 Tax=Panagrolaimus sp. PS1159 TaxID=55785 RepID=A0AC35EVQ3_9BILA